MITDLYFDTKPVIAVYAGANVATPRQGEVMVWRATGHMDYYPLPTANGIAHLVSLSGDRVTVADASGDTYVFDPASGKWLTR